MLDVDLDHVVVWLMTKLSSTVRVDFCQDGQHSSGDIVMIWCDNLVPTRFLAVLCDRFSPRWSSDLHLVASLEKLDAAFLIRISGHGLSPYQ